MRSSGYSTHCTEYRPCHSAMSTPTPQNLPKNRRALDSTQPIPTTFYGQLSLARFPRDEGRGVAERSTLRKYYVEKPLRPACDPVCISTPGRALLVDNAVGALTDEIMPLAALITSNKPRRSRSRAWRIWSLYQGIFSSLVQNGLIERRRRIEDDGGP